MLEQVHVVADEDAEFERIQTLPGGAVPVVDRDGSPSISWTVPGTDGKVETLSYRPGAFRLRTTSQQDRLLLVREARSSGWSASVDGEATRILPAAGLFFAIPIPAGIHEVEVTYRAPGLALGLALASAWLAAIAGGAWRARRH